VAISSKFLVRFRGKHLFNPANLGLGAAMLITSHAWCSPSQWGESTVALAWFAALGCAVVHRAFRGDVSLAFLVSWISLRAGRVLYLGQKLPVLAHQLSVGSLIIFTFFMISDPKTTPSHRLARVLYAACVAGLGLFIQYGLWKQNALIWSLLLCSPLVPLFDAVFKAKRFAWPERKPSCPPLVPALASSPRS
jgi:Na+-translocating ferredoxin:NAD+ oxidoreductase RnfD subunit